MATHPTWKDSVVTPELLSVPDVDGDSKSCPGSKACPHCIGYHPAVLAASSGWLWYPQCCFWKEDPVISEHHFQPPSLKRHFPTARSLPESLRNSMACGNQDSEVRSDSPEKHEEKNPSPSDGKLGEIPAWWMVRGSLVVQKGITSLGVPLGCSSLPSRWHQGRWALPSCAKGGRTIINMNNNHYEWAV